MSDKAFEWKIGGEQATHMVHESHTTGVIITRGKIFTLEESGCQHTD